MGKKLKLSIEWDGKEYTDEDTIFSESSDVNPGDKTLPIMAEQLEIMMLKILAKIVSNA